MTKQAERRAVFAFGVTFVVVMLVLAVAIPNPTRTQYETFKTVLALAAAGVAAFIPGFLELTVPGWVRAGGALAVFVLVYTKSPATLVVDGPLAVSLGSTTSNSGPVTLDLGRVAANEETEAVLTVHNLSPYARRVEAQAAGAGLTVAWTSESEDEAIPPMGRRDIRVLARTPESVKGSLSFREGPTSLREIVVTTEVAPPTVAKEQQSGAKASGHGGDFSEPYALCLGPAPRQYTLVPESIRFWLTGDRTCGDWSHCNRVAADDSDVCYSFSLQGHSEDGSARNSEGHLRAEYKLNRAQAMLR